MDNLVWLAVLVIFLATLVGIVVRRIAKDKCLRLFHDHHVTYVASAGTALWGDLTVSGQGLELRYDEPFVTRRKLVKSSYLVFADQLDDCACICRTASALTAEERADRQRQIERTFSPGLVTRAVRAGRNFVDLLRDAITKSLGVFMGAMAGHGAIGKAMQSRAGDVDEVGKSLVGVVANAYEPLLERHIGGQVVLSIDNLPGASSPVSEFPGYLVEYTERYLAVFNVEHEALESMDVTVQESMARDGAEFDLNPDRIRIKCTGPEVIILSEVEVDGDTRSLDIVLPPGCEVELNRDTDGPVRVVTERTRRLDWVCPRSRARIRFASTTSDAHSRRWTGRGISPEHEARED